MEDKYIEDDMAQFYTRRNPQRSGDGVNSVEIVAPAPAPQPAGSSVAVPPASATPPPEPERRPVCGFLFSVSRTADGEFWPLHEGANTIGSMETCDVVLSERTVASRHAELRIERKENGLAVKLTSLATEHGTSLNGLKLGDEETGCYDRDIIALGQGYQLLLLVADAQKYGLAQAETFADGSDATEEEAAGSEETVGFSSGDGELTDATRLM